MKQACLLNMLPTRSWQWRRRYPAHLYVLVGCCQDRAVCYCAKLQPLACKQHRQTHQPLRCMAVQPTDLHAAGHGQHVTRQHSSQRIHTGRKGQGCTIGITLLPVLRRAWALVVARRDCSHHTDRHSDAGQQRKSCVIYRDFCLHWQGVPHNGHSHLWCQVCKCRQCVCGQV